MAKKEFNYKGKKIVVDEKEKEASITIDNQYRVKASYMFQNIPMWSCKSAYAMTSTPHLLAKRIVDVLDILTAPTTAPVEGLELLAKENK